MLKRDALSADLSIGSVFASLRWWVPVQTPLVVSLACCSFVFVSTSVFQIDLK